MQILISTDELSDLVAFHKSKGHSIGFVPTMGSLHEGHISLIKRSLAENDFTVCSIFVNPSQFNDPKDYARYPRQLSSDTRILEQAGCNALFAPSAEAIYPTPDEHIYNLSPVDQVLEGAFRPGHFNGVASVVKRLLELVRPTRAYFGRKDYQQYLVIQTLAARYGLDAEIVGCEIVRESSGLAMSSRNQLLSEAGKETARRLSETLSHVKTLAGRATMGELEAAGRRRLEGTPGIELEYFSIAQPQTLQPFSEHAPSDQPAIALLAAQVEGVRLIDNMPIWE